MRLISAVFFITYFIAKKLQSMITNNYSFVFCVTVQWEPQEGQQVSMKISMPLVWYRALSSSESSGSSLLQFSHTTVLLSVPSQTRHRRVCSELTYCQQFSPNILYTFRRLPLPCLHTASISMLSTFINMLMGRYPWECNEGSTVSYISSAVYVFIFTSPSLFVSMYFFWQSVHGCKIAEVFVRGVFFFCVTISADAISF